MEFQTPQILNNTNPKRISVTLKYCDLTKETAFALTSTDLEQLININTHLSQSLSQQEIINVTGTNNLVINSGQLTGAKALRIVGDIDITGVVDPIGIMFSGTPTNTTSYDIYVNDNYKLRLYPKTDRADAIEFTKADGNTVVAKIDTTNGVLVANKLQVLDGASAGKVLTSDANGLASWSTGGGGSITADNGITLTGSNVQLGGQLTTWDKPIVTKLLNVGDAGYDPVNLYKNYRNFVITGQGNLIVGTDPVFNYPDYVTLQRYDNGKITIVNQNTTYSGAQPYSCLYIGNFNKNTSRGIYMDFINADTTVTNNTAPGSVASIPTNACTFIVNTAVTDTPFITTYPVFQCGGKTNDVTPTIAGSGIVGATITIMQTTPTVTNYTTTVAATGLWTFTFPTLGAGIYNYSVKQTVGVVDSANTTACSFEVDTTAVDMPFVNYPTAYNNGISKDSTPTISGTGIPGATITIMQTAPTVTNYTTTVAVSGSWTYTFASQPNGTTITLSVKQTVGVTDSSPTASRSFTVNTSAAETPVITIPITAECGGSTSDTTPKITGTGTAGQIITISQTTPTTKTYYTKVQPTGIFEFNFPLLTAGTYTYTITQSTLGTMSNYWEIQAYIAQRGARGFYWEIKPYVTDQSYLGRMEMRAVGVQGTSTDQNGAKQQAIISSKSFGNGVFTANSAPYGLSIEQYGVGHGLLLVGNSTSYDSNYGYWLSNDYQSLLKIINHADKQVAVMEWSNNGNITQPFIDYDNQPLTNGTLGGGIKINFSSNADGNVFDITSSGDGLLMNMATSGINGGGIYLDNGGSQDSARFRGRLASVGTSAVITNKGSIIVGVNDTTYTAVKGYADYSTIYNNGSEARSHKSISSTYTVLSTDNFLKVSVGQAANGIITLPDPATCPNKSLQLYKENVGNMDFTCGVANKITLKGSLNVTSVTVATQYVLYRMESVPSGATWAWLIIET